MQKWIHFAENEADFSYYLDYDFFLVNILYSIKH